MDVAQFEVKLQEIQNIVCMDSIPLELVIYFDQTAESYVPIPDWIIEKEGTKRVRIIAKDGKKTTHRCLRRLCHRRIFTIIAHL